MKKSKSDKSSGQNKKTSKSVDQLPKKRLWLFRIIALIIIPIIFFSILEFTLWLFNFGNPTTAFVEEKLSDTKYVRDNSTFSYRFFPEELAPEFIPFKFKADKPDDVFRIFILGGSATQGIPEPAYSFGRILDVMLQLRYPDTKFEIISLAMTAINSHVVLEIAKECTEYDPDLFVVYMGNNEVVGPYGPGTVFTPIISNSLLLDITKKLKTTKISQLLSLGLDKLNVFESQYKRWEGMEMFLQNQVSLTDPELEVTYQNFSDNLNKLNQISYENGIKIIYGTVVSNLKDCPPFNSKHRADLKLSDQQKWEELYSTGAVHEEAGEYNAAISHYLEAVKIDNQYADLHFRVGRCYWFTGNFTEASKSYILAREYDSNRFRADNRINEIIRDASSAVPGTTFLADALSEIENQSPNGITGNEFLYEHVHLNFKGNYLIAKTIFNQLEQIFSDVLKDQRKDKTIQINDSLCALYLAFNNFEHRRILELVLTGFIKQPPFTNQLYHSETVNRLENEIDSLQYFIQVQDSNQTINAFEDALRKRPEDWFLHNKFADYLAEDNVRKYQEALDHYQFVTKKIPHDPNVYVKCGVVLGKLGRLQESLDYFQLALSKNPKVARAYFNSGLIYQKLQKFDLALENYENAVFYEPVHSRAYNNMAFIFSQKGDIPKAMAIIDEGLTATPKDLLLNYNKAMFLYQSGRKTEAIRQLRHVLQISPNEVMVQEKLNEWLAKEKQ